MRPTETETGWNITDRTAFQARLEGNKISGNKSTFFNEFKFPWVAVMVGAIILSIVGLFWILIGNLMFLNFNTL